MSSNPVWTAASIAAGVSAVIALLIAFGVQLNTTQVTAIMGAVAVAGPFLVPLLANSKVTPLAAPTDEDGVALVRPGGALPRAQARGQARK